MTGQSRVEFLQAQTLAAAPSVAHGTALKRYSSARGRRDLRTEALVSSDDSESEDSDAGIMVSDEDSEAGSMVAQSCSSVKAKEPVKPTGPPPDLDPMLFISSSKVLSFVSATCESH